MSDSDDDLERAQALIEVGRSDDAVQIIGRLLAREPDSFVGHCLMANAELLREDCDAALSSAERAVALRPEHEWGHRLCSIALRQLLHLDAALREAEETVRLAPYSELSYITLANCHLMYEGTAAAQRAYRAARKAVDLAPEDPDSHLTLGRAHAAAADSPSAQACYERALALDPLNSSARNNLAAEQVRAGRYTTAGRNLIDALALDPHETLLQRNLLRAVSAWLLRRADIAALVWVCAWSADLLHDPVLVRILDGVLAVAVVASVVVAYRRLPTVMRRLVRKRPSREHPGRIVAWICTVLPFGSLFLRTVATDSVQPVTMTVNGLATVAVFVTVFRAYGRLIDAAERLQKRWAHRMFLRREDRTAVAPRRFTGLRLLLIRWPVGGSLIAVAIIASVVAHARTNSEPPASFHVGQCLKAGTLSDEVVTPEQIVPCDDALAVYRVTSIATYSPAAGSGPCVSATSEAMTVDGGKTRILCLSEVRRIS